ncbi:DUF2357 domain-containing protein [Leyella stercorea]|uniref:DUF2357 domain-containing protein n=1 Tax=Leyella stercorea TaxID=363265 RepID=UPI002665D4E4|nr:DUF2357 domain-containing protein [Leyella stercorea]
MDVLVFECDDYKLIVSTGSIDYAWARFARRVKDSAQSYCDYRSSKEGKLSLYMPYGEHIGMTMLNPDVKRTEWVNKHPVFFETCEYQFAVELKNIYDTSHERMLPRVRHQIKSIGDAFKFYKNGSHSGILVGSIDFLNSPGKFDFVFEYRDKEGTLVKQSMEMYVASPKLDTKKDLQEIITLINEEYENYVFDYLTLTFSSFSLKKAERNNSIIWLSIFKNVVDSYFKNVKFIMSRPNNKPVRKTYTARPAKIRRWSQQEAERFADRRYDAENYYYRYEVTENTTNTKENRFVKYSLRVLDKKFNEVFNEVSGLYKDMDESERNNLYEYKMMFKRMRSNVFFKKVGEFEGFRQESSILQQRTGYSQIYKSWLMLKNSLDLVEGKTDIGMKKIWELYEIWCFLIMKRLIAKVLCIDISDKERVIENKNEMLDTLLNSGMTHEVVFKADNGDFVKLEYQHTYNRRSKDEMKTTTTEQRPDIIVSIKKSDGFTLTYLYDAKYRVQDDVNDSELDEGVDIDIADYPLPDAINQMHRYRDAIYYAMKDDVCPRGKEIIGGYILFPGRTEGDKIENRYFYQSIRKVNIGAFPLLPADSEHKDQIVQCNLLEKHLREILLEESVMEHIKDSVPQKGLAYSIAPEDENMLVLVGYSKKDQWDKVLANKLYYVRAGMVTGSLRLVAGFEHCKYVLLYDNNRRNMYKLSGNGPRLVSGAELQKLGFDSRKDFYLCFDLESSEAIVEFPDVRTGRLLKIKNEYNPYKKEPYFATLKELLE